MLDIPHLRINPDLDPTESFRTGFGIPWDKCGVGVRDCSGEVEDGAYGDGVLESGGVEGDERGAGVWEGRSAGEGEFEGGL